MKQLPRVVAVAAVLLASASPAVTQSGSTQAPGAVTQLLVERHAFAEIPLKSKLTRKIKMSDDT